MLKGKEKKKIHFLGIGGVGMSGLALILKKLGHHVSGCDIALNNYTKMLEKHGIKVFIGHSPLHLENIDILVYSSAIPKDNKELLEAKKRGIWVIPRAQMLAEIMSLHPKSIVITGSHGKTTTTSMLAEVFLKLNKNPTVIVGGIVNNLRTHSLLGGSEYLIAEGDESDASFLCYSPFIEVITNIDEEHLDFYADFKAIKKAFINFINRCNENGQVILCGDDKGVKEVISDISGPFLFYGFGKDNDVRGVIKKEGAFSEVEVFYREEYLGNLRLRIPGRHNVLNALAVIAVTLFLSFPIKEVLKALSQFNGVKRRLEFKGIWKGALLYDDYAHHPREIQATLSAIRNLHKEKFVIGIFQPHRYTRLKALWNEFLLALKDLEVVIVTDVYSAGESPIPAISGEVFYENLKIIRKTKPTFFAKDFREILEILNKIIEGKEVVMTIGAGDIYKLWNYLKDLEEEYEENRMC